MKRSHQYKLFVLFELALIWFFINQISRPVQTIDYLHRVSYSVLVHGGPRLYKRLSRERSGEQVLPRETQAMIALLRKHRVSSYRWSPRMNDKYLFYQRLVEGAYPIRAAANARYLVGFADEAAFKNRVIIDRIGEVALAADD